MPRPLSDADADLRAEFPRTIRSPWCPECGWPHGRHLPGCPDDDSSDGCDLDDDGEPRDPEEI